MWKPAIASGQKGGTFMMRSPGAALILITRERLGGERCLAVATRMSISRESDTKTIKGATR